LLISAGSHDSSSPFIADPSTVEIVIENSLMFNRPLRKAVVCAINGGDLIGVGDTG